ncbi:MAG: hypothetical protein HQ559_07335 [Lentisphaerae bacterium]|nr:hypothetical protein [Lentisphaerota bacterium]
MKTLPPIILCLCLAGCTMLPSWSEIRDAANVRYEEGKDSVREEIADKIDPEIQEGPDAPAEDLPPDPYPSRPPPDGPVVNSTKWKPEGNDGNAVLVIGRKYPAEDIEGVRLCADPEGTDTVRKGEARSPYYSIIEETGKARNGGRTHARWEEDGDWYEEKAGKPLYVVLDIKEGSLTAEAVGADRIVFKIKRPGKDQVFK